MDHKTMKFKKNYRLLGRFSFLPGDVCDIREDVANELKAAGFVETAQRKPLKAQSRKAAGSKDFNPQNDKEQ
jgi:hypothetical protein